MDTQADTQENTQKWKLGTAGIVAIIIIGALLVIGAVALLSSLTGAEQPGAELKGSWYNGTGAFIYYFEESEEIRFTVTGDGMGKVFDSYGEWGDWELQPNGTLCITGEESGYFELTYRIDNDILTLIDEDGDARSYSKTR